MQQDRAKAEEAKGFVRTVNRCYTCGKFFEWHEPAVECPGCATNRITVAKAVFGAGVPNGNLPPGMDRLTEGCSDPARLRLTVPKQIGIANMRGKNKNQER